MTEYGKSFWEKAYKDDPASVQVADVLLENEIREMTPGTALDLGCGTGENAIMLANRGWNVTGIDWIQTAIDIANNHAKRRNVNASFITGDITNWQPPRQYNLVISTFAYPGSETRNKWIETAKKSITLGGEFIFIEWDRSMAEQWQLDKGDLPSLDELETLCADLKTIKKQIVRIHNHKMTAQDPRQVANIAIFRAAKL